MNDDCKDKHLSIQAYLDGELSEPQAGPLRQHLLACQSCRTAAQSEKAIKGWFQAGPAVAVPEGFAARVARRAFAGDTGEVPGSAGAPAHETPIFQFVLRVTAAAAAILLLLSGMVRLSSLPKSDNMIGEPRVPTLEQVIQDLERHNGEDTEAALPARHTKADEAK